MGDEEECKILQEEELEVLRSIYEGDSAFTIHSDTKFQYKMGSQESDRYESFHGVNFIFISKGGNNSCSLLRLVNIFSDI